MVMRISWSGLRTHEECKQKGYLSRTGKGATLDNKRNFLPGTVTDRVVRSWLEDDPAANQGVMPDMVADMLDAGWKKILTMPDGTPEKGIVRWRDPGDQAKVKAECIEAVTKIEPLLMQYVVPFEYQPDFRFDAPLLLEHPDGGYEQVLLIGYMDILVRDNQGRWMVWDVKHTKDEGYWRKTVGQLGFYDFAIELLFGSPTLRTGLMQPLCKSVIKPYQPSQIGRAHV